MPIPDSLMQKIEVFKENAHVHRFNSELFNEISWVEVMLGQGLYPNGYHPLVDVVPDDEFARRMAHIKRVLDTAVDYLPRHEEFIAQHCKAQN
jgi:tryptophan halogenase